MSMSSGGVSRREMFLKVALAFNGAVGVLLGIPVVRYLLSPVTRGRKPGYDSWISLGSINQFPSGETRLATYRNPVANVTDGETANIPCWVRHISDDKFQVFAINCAHLGCPVRWFRKSGLFMCPCHGGAYYADGSRASGPPERGLFEYAFKIVDGNLHIQAGEMPTPGPSAPGLSALIQIQHAKGADAHREIAEPVVDPSRGATSAQADSQVVVRDNMDRAPVLHASLKRLPCA
jgi:menaquinol-cytochrome c reductase iron-sulfur subunit